MQLNGVEIIGHYAPCCIVRLPKCNFCKVQVKKSGLDNIHQKVK